MLIKKYKSEANNPLANKLKSYSAVTAAFLAASSGAEAQILFHDVNPDVVLHNNNFSVDLDQDGMTDFILQQFSTTGSSSSYKAAGIGAPSSRLTNRIITKFVSSSFLYADRLNAAAPIGPATPGWQTMQQGISNVFPMGINFSNSFYGFWGGQSGYLGVEFKTNGNTYYGWIECYVAANADTLIIKGFAYDSVPNAVIYSSDTGMVFTGINQSISLNQVSNFYPNAVKNGNAFINVVAKENNELRIEIMNGMGQVLLTESRKLIAGKNILQLDVNQIANGTYFVKLTTGEQHYFRKLILSK